MRKQFTIVRPNPSDSIPGVEKEFELIIAFNDEMYSRSVYDALVKLSDDILNEGWQSYPYAFTFNMMGSQFYLALALLAQNMDQ